jgi:hypothetical protein
LSVQSSVFRVQEKKMVSRLCFLLNAEPLNTRITVSIETMINVDSKLKRISNMFGYGLRALLIKGTFKSSG